MNKKPMSDEANVERLKQELSKATQKLNAARSQRVWALVSHLSQEDLSLLGRIIHVHFHGDGEDD